MRSPVGVAFLVVAWPLVGGAAVAFAQPAPAAAASSRWELDVHGGFTPANASDITGESHQIPRGPIVSAINGLPTYRVSSWWLGDGVNMTNTVGSALNTIDRIIPLPVTSRLARNGSGAAIGARLTRHINRRFDVEASVDFSTASVTLLDDARERVQEAVESFVPAWTAILGPRTNLERVTATLDAAEGRTRDVIASGALNLYVLEGTRWRPFVTFGGGLIATIGDRPSYTVTGRQKFSLAVGSPIDETDTVLIRIANDRYAPAFVVGAGVRRETGGRLGLRADLRAHITSNSLTTFVDAEPQAAVPPPGSPTATLATDTVPALVLSNVPSSTERTFGAPFGGEVMTFRGGGAIARVTLTVGVYWKF